MKFIKQYDNESGIKVSSDLLVGNGRLSKNCMRIVFKKGFLITTLLESLIYFQYISSGVTATKLTTPVSPPSQGWDFVARSVERSRGGKQLTKKRRFYKINIHEP
ncbi:MAG: hypothetical protein E3K36_14650 [Candidatus Brocadia sp.]|nr:hypothetical protein [Candidatus Brocadia sp.]